MEPPLTTTYFALTLDPNPTVEISTASLKVDQLVDAATTLTMEEMPQSHVTTKRGRDDNQRSPLEEGSPRLVEEDALMGVTTFLQIPHVFLSRLAWTLEKTLLLCRRRIYHSSKTSLKLRR